MNLGFLIRQRGNLDKTNQRTLRGERNVDDLCRKCVFCKQVLQREQHFHGRIGIFQRSGIRITELGKYKIHQFHRTFLRVGKLRSFQRVRADVNT